jgi:hypothetical protein
MWEMFGRGEGDGMERAVYLHQRVVNYDKYPVPLHSKLYTLSHPGGRTNTNTNTNTQSQTKKKKRESKQSNREQKIQKRTSIPQPKQEQHWQLEKSI